MRVLAFIGCLLMAIISVGQQVPSGMTSPSAKLLPSAKELKGWKEVAGSFRFGKGESLTEIYDGGYMLYIDNGVQEAAQKIYHKDNVYLTLTTHFMKSQKASKAFVAYWKKMFKNEKLTKTKGVGEGFTMSSNGATMTYWSNERVFVTLMATNDGKEGVEAVSTALKVIVQKMKKN